MSAPAAGSAPQQLIEDEELGKAFDGRLLRRLWHWVAPYRRRALLSISLVAPAFALEVLGPKVLGAGADFWSGTPLAGWLAPPAGLDPIWWLGGLFVVISLGNLLLDYVQAILLAVTGQAAMRDMRRDVFAHIQKLHMGFFDGYPVGRLVTRATGDIEHVSEAFTAGLVLLVTDVLRMLGFAVVLFHTDAHLAGWTFLVIPPLAFAAFVFRWRVRGAFRRSRVLIARLNATLQESVSGMKVIQLFSREARNQREFEKLNAEHRDSWVDSIRYDSALFTVVELAAGVVFSIVIWKATGYGSAGVIVQFVRYMQRFFMPLRDLSAKYSVMQSAMASLERIFVLLDTQPAVRDAVAPASTPLGSDDSASLSASLAVEPAAARVARPAAGLGEVEFRDVWFAYRGEEWVLRGLSFRVAAGERAAFVGATGAGKTTVIKLLARLYEIQKGAILLDGVDIRMIPQHELRRRVAMVLQDVFLFSGTIADNLALGRADLTLPVLQRAAAAVEADRFIARLPRGYETELRERGANLSAGQRQLLSFARALAHGADVLVLDEATSSIDTETEATLQRGIHKLMEGKTALVIAHRLSTIEDVDRIYALHHGKLAESGTHAQLLAQGGLYARLYRLQYGGEAAPGAAAG
ncbi:MAG TPA: ABC transporter ATP-binding protein [Myxococcota bacterium]|nr:ABC transporter ATP-binding protein [Myxococcota bacterium]